MKNFETLKTPRREFIGSLVAGAAAFGLSSVATPLEATASRQYAVSSDPDQWFDQIKGKHRAVYDVPKPHGPFPFAWSRVFLLTNEKTGTPASDCSVVVVLRHDAIAFALPSPLWEKYKLGEFFKIMDPKTNAPSIRNPYWQPKPGDFVFPAIGQVAIGINELQADGVMFCACELAVMVQSAAIAAGMKKDPEEVRKEWMASMLPGIQPVPSGIWALGRAQEHGCAFIFTG